VFHRRPQCDPPSGWSPPAWLDLPPCRLPGGQPWRFFPGRWGTPPGGGNPGWPQALSPDAVCQHNWCFPVRGPWGCQARRAGALPGTQGWPIRAPVPGGSPRAGVPVPPCRPPARQPVLRCVPRTVPGPDGAAGMRASAARGNGNAAGPPPPAAAVRDAPQRAPAPRRRQRFRRLYPCAWITFPWLGNSSGETAAARPGKLPAAAPDPCAWHRVRTKCVAWPCNGDAEPWSNGGTKSPQRKTPKTPWPAPIAGRWPPAGPSGGPQVPEDGQMGRGTAREGSGRPQDREGAMTDRTAGAVVTPEKWRTP